jgi:hypothetical protein
MSGNTKESSQQPTTSSGRKKRVHRSSSTPPEAVSISFVAGQEGRRFGPLVVTSAERRYLKPKSRMCYVETQCKDCKTVRWMSWDMLTRHGVKNCQACLRPMSLPSWLTNRMRKAMLRCTDPNNHVWHRYGGRGIEYRFPDVYSGALWVAQNLGVEPEKKLDRIDNNGHYEPGNLRWVTQQEQCWNTEKSVLKGWVYHPEEWPFAASTVRVKLLKGYSREQILDQARAIAARQKGKNWRGIAARLASMTS